MNEGPLTPDATLRAIFDAIDFKHPVESIQRIPAAAAARRASDAQVAGLPIVLFDVDGVLVAPDGTPTPGLPVLIDVLRLLGFEVRFWSAGGTKHIAKVLPRVGIYGGFRTHEKPTYPMTEEDALAIVGRRPALQIDDDPTERVADWPFMQWAATPAPQPATCPLGCGCRLGTDDADARECACAGPCTLSDDEQVRFGWTPAPQPATPPLEGDPDGLRLHDDARRDLVPRSLEDVILALARESLAHRDEYASKGYVMEPMPFEVEVRARLAEPPSTPEPETGA